MAEIERHMISAGFVEEALDSLRRARRPTEPLLSRLGLPPVVTALAMEWEVPEDVHSQHGVETETATTTPWFAPTIQSSHELDTLDDPLDEDEIERNIAEINAAIRRSAARKS